MTPNSANGTPTSIKVTVITAGFSERDWRGSASNGNGHLRHEGNGGDGAREDSEPPRDASQPHRIVRIGRNLAVPYNGAENNLTIGLGLRRKLCAILERERFDLLHVHCPVSPVLPLLALRVARQPIVGTFHSTVTSDLAFRLFRRALLPSFRRIDRSLAVSEEARSCVLRHFPGPVDVLPNGVSLALRWAIESLLSGEGPCQPLTVTGGSPVSTTFVGTTTRPLETLREDR